MRKTLTLVMALSTSMTSGTVSHGSDARAVTKADVIVFFGQSNCEGWAGINELPPTLRQPQHQLQIWSQSAQRWQPVTAGLNTNMTPAAPFFGAEIGMAEALNDGTGPVWLVKAALSPSSLGPTPGPWNEWGVNAGELYTLLLATVDAAMARLRQQGIEPRVRLVCMMQGESDAVPPALSLAYEQNLRELLTQLRRDLRQRHLVGSQQPWIRIGLINRGLLQVGFVGADIVRAAQRRVAAGLSRCDLIETSDLGLQGDLVHFDGDGLRELGRRFLAAPW